jgi:Protein of unknown function (DUF3095)
MDATAPTDGFYESLPILRDFTRVMDPALFAPLPDSWMVGVADVAQSTKAIAENRYKAVNMAGAAVIVAITNALAGRDFPFVFGGDGASFAVAAEATTAARQALAETATWVKEDLDLTLRIGMVPVADIRARGLDVRVARYAPSENISIAMFSGGGIAWADAAMKRGDITIEPALEARALRRPGESVCARKIKVLALTFLYFLIMNFSIKVGSFIPAKYTSELVDNSDFRKFDDSLRMVLDCTPGLADEIERHLADCAAKKIVRYGTHRQQAAMMTCFTPSPTKSNHVHFIDGAMGGYAMAASALKRSATGG